MPEKAAEKSPPRAPRGAAGGRAGKRAARPKAAGSARSGAVAGAGAGGASGTGRRPAEERTAGSEADTAMGTGAGESGSPHSSFEPGAAGRVEGSHDRLGHALTELLENPLVTATVSRALGAREKAAQAQELWMAALNLPSAADMERLTRRLRSVSQRLEGVEDGVQNLGRSFVQGTGIEQRLVAIEQRLASIEETLDVMRAASQARGPAGD
ncbi:MAG: hypothetical protein ACYDA6_08900 [Solirubrobacteraceae bacterium]